MPSFEEQKRMRPWCFAGSTKEIQVSDCDNPKCKFPEDCVWKMREVRKESVPSDKISHE